MMVSSCLVSSLDIVRMENIIQPLLGNQTCDNCDSDTGDSLASYREHSVQYLTYLWILSIISLSTFIKVHYLYKVSIRAVNGTSRSFTATCRFSVVFNRYLTVRALVCAFNKEKALVRASSVIIKSSRILV